MIVPMKKVAVIARSIDTEQTVKDLRKAGLLHVEHTHAPQGKPIATLQEELALVNSALDVFLKNEAINKPNIQPKEITTDWHIKARHLIDLAKRYEQLELFGQKLQAAISEWQKWGDFQPQNIKELLRREIYVSLYQVPIKKISVFPPEAVVKTIFISSGMASVIVFSQKKLEIPFKEIALPEYSLSHMQKRLAEDIQLMRSLKDEISKAFCFYEDFLKVKQNLEKELELQLAIKGMAEHGALTYIMGYVPVDQIERLRQQAQIKKWGIVVREPTDEDNVPVLLRNPKWIEIIKPIFKFLEILPGYRELDISLPFLIFFSIFFGILIGDAGYGLVYFLIAFWLQQKARKKKLDTSSFYLFYILSFCAIVWGVLTGTFFGQEWVLKSGYKPLAPMLADEKGLQRFCFFLGALHLSLAHGWRAIIKAPSLSALGDLGSICVLWAVFFIAKTLILGDGFPSFCIWLFICGATLIIIFTNPQKNILKFAEEWIAWLITLPFSFIGNFADVVSYIRLFAVGMAGVAIADAFNAMAAMVGKGNMLMILLSIFIALIGNVLGLVLGPVSVLVHGVRLNLLEFSGHVGLSWSGVPYKPLKE